MGLNDDVNEEFGPLDDTKVITAVDKLPTDFEPVKESDVFDEPTVAGEVPKFNAIFEFEEKRRNDVADIQEVQSSVTRNCGVCMEDASVIGSLIPGFISDDRPLAVFTEDPTKTQYSETMQSLDTELDRQCQSMSSSLTELAEGYLGFAKQLSAIYAGKYPLLLSRLNTSIAKMLFALKKDDVNQIGYIFNNRVRWTQLMDYPLNTIISDCTSASSGRIAEEFKGSFLDKSVDKFAAILGNRSFSKTLMFLIQDHSHYIVISGQIYEVDAETHLLSTFLGETPGIDEERLTLGNLFRLLESNALYRYIQSLECVFQSEIDVLKGVGKQVQEIKANETATVAETIEPLMALSSMVSAVRHNAVGVMNVQSGIYGLLEALCCLVDDLAATQAVAV